MIKDRRGKTPNFVLERVDYRWRIRHQPTGLIQESPDHGKPTPSQQRTMINRLKAKVR